MRLCTAAVMTFLAGLGCSAPPQPILGPGTTKDTGVGGDTGAGSGGWSPGDPIPGWEDFDCSLDVLGAAHVEVGLPDVRWGTLGISAVDGGGAPAQLTLNLDLLDCRGGPCPDGEPGDLTFAEVDAPVDVSGDGYRSRGQGWFGTPAKPFGRVHVQATTLLAQFFTSSGSSGAALCLSRVRPDMVAGVVLVQQLSGAQMESAWYGPVATLLPFEVRFVDHAALDANVPTSGLSPPPGSESQCFAYGHYISYDTIWPWDLITDSDVRDAVYARYTPWNWP